MNDKKLKFLTIGVFTLVLINIILIAFLFVGRPDSHMQTRPRRAERERINKGSQFLERSLNLDKDQRQKFREATKQHRKKRESIDEKIFRTRNVMISYIVDQVPNEKVIDSLLLTLQDLHFQNEKELSEHFYHLKSICNKKQLRRLDEILSKNGNFEASKR